MLIQYTRNKDFSDDQANNVGGRSTVDTTGLDSELDEIKTVLDGARTYFALLLRDDLSQIVSADALVYIAASLNSSVFVWRGQWLTATAYKVNNMAFEAGASYVCVVGHTSGTFATDLAAVKWNLLAQQGSATALPSQSGNANKVLTTDASNPSWASPQTLVNSNTPAGNIAATTIQTAINELDADKPNKPVPILEGGTGATTAVAARVAIAAAGLADNNPFTGNNTHAGTETMVGKSIIEAKASVAVNTTTMNPWSLGNYVDATGGPVTFADMAAAPQAGAEVELYMNTANIFTDGAVFEVDGDANWTAEAGDRVLLRAKSTTVFTVHPRRKTGIPIAGSILQTALSPRAVAVSDFTGTPSWVNEIHVSLNDISVTAASPIILQLGTGAGFVVAGYIGTAQSDGASSLLASGFQFLPTAYSAAAATLYGTLILSRHSGNQWAAQSCVGKGDSAVGALMGGAVSLPGILTQLRLTTVGGTDTVDAGSWNVRYKA